jgi:nucleotide-binding universal stress UspA family protein
VTTATARITVRFRNILFPTDFSPAAAQAIPYVQEIAKHYDADLVTLHVRPPVVNPMTAQALGRRASKLQKLKTTSTGKRFSLHSPEFAQRS